MVDASNFPEDTHVVVLVGGPACGLATAMHRLMPTITLPIYHDKQSNSWCPVTDNVFKVLAMSIVPSMACYVRDGIGHCQCGSPDCCVTYARYRHVHTTHPKNKA